MWFKKGKNSHAGKLWIMSSTYVYINIYKEDALNKKSSKLKFPYHENQFNRWKKDESSPWSHDGWIRATTAFDMIRPRTPCTGWSLSHKRSKSTHEKFFFQETKNMPV